MSLHYFETFCKTLYKSIDIFKVGKLPNPLFTFIFHGIQSLRPMPVLHSWLPATPILYLHPHQLSFLLPPLTFLISLNLYLLNLMATINLCGYLIYCLFCTIMIYWVQLMVLSPAHLHLYLMTMVKMFLVQPLQPEVRRINFLAGSM